MANRRCERIRVEAYGYGPQTVVAAIEDESKRFLYVTPVDENGEVASANRRTWIIEKAAIAERTPVTFEERN